MDEQAAGDYLQRVVEYVLMLDLAVPEMLTRADANCQMCLRSTAFPAVSTHRSSPVHAYGQLWPSATSSVAFSAWRSSLVPRVAVPASAGNLFAVILRRPAAQSALTSVALAPQDNASYGTQSIQQEQRCLTGAAGVAALIRLL